MGQTFMLCRVFVAQREGYNNTWINTYTPFVDAYAADDTLVTSQEVCWSTLTDAVTT